MTKIGLGKEGLEISSSTSKGLAIAALVVAITAVIMPLISLYFVWIALIMIALAIFTENKVNNVDKEGEEDKKRKTFNKAAYIICLVNVILLSPATRMAFAGERLQGDYSLEMTTLILFVVPVIIFAIKNPSKENQTQTQEAHSL